MNPFGGLLLGKNRNGRAFVKKSVFINGLNKNEQLHNMQVWRNWQTRKIQVLIRAILYGFDPLHLHQRKSESDTVTVFGLDFFYC